MYWEQLSISGLELLLLILFFIITHFFVWFVTKKQEHKTKIHKAVPVYNPYERGRNTF